MLTFCESARYMLPYLSTLVNTFFDFFKSSFAVVLQQRFLYYHIFSSLSTTFFDFSQNLFCCYTLLLCDSELYTTISFHSCQHFFYLFCSYCYHSLRNQQQQDIYYHPYFHLSTLFYIFFYFFAAPGLLFTAGYSKHNKRYGSSSSSISGNRPTPS